MKQSIILSGGIAVGGVLAYLAFANIGQRSSDAASVTHSRPAAETAIETRETTEIPNDMLWVKQQLARQSEEIASLRAELAKRPQLQAAKPNAADNPTPWDPATRKAEEEQVLEHIAEIEANFATERQDPTWAAAMATTIKDVVSKNEVFRAALDSIECHSVTCRIEMKDDGSGNLSGQIPGFMLQMGAHLPSSAFEKVDDGNGRKSVVFYMSKEGSGA